MFESLFFAVTVAVSSGAAPSPAPAASAQAAPASPLKEIGRLKISPACTSIVVRANSAIGASLRNDQTLAMTIATLRRVNLDGSTFEKAKGMHEIDRLATDMRLSAIAAESQIAKLREMAEESTDPERKAELKSFADALGGALFRQKRAGADLQRMLVVIEGRDNVAETAADMKEISSVTRPEAQPALIPSYSPGANAVDTKHYNDMALSAAREMDDRVTAILADESKASEHIAGAVSGC